MHKQPCEPSIGTDLEMFLFDNEQGQIVPCVGVLPGTKEEPYKPPGYRDGFAIQEDNVMVEFNIPPATDFGTFYNNVRDAKVMVMKELQDRYGAKYSLYSKHATHKFTPCELDSKQAQLIGCEPDFDAYSGGTIRENTTPLSNMRSCGGHIHLGGNFQCPDFVAALFAELFFNLGTGGDIGFNPDCPRVAWYGMPGIYRPKPYGIEYRTPNNEWATHNSTIEQVGYVGIRLASWLTNTDTIEIQRAFRGVPWLKLKTMLLRPRGPARGKLESEVYTAATNAGVPL